MLKKFIKKSAVLFSLLFTFVSVFAFSLTAFASDTDATDDIAPASLSGNSYADGMVIIDDSASILSDEAAVAESMEDFTKYGKAAFVSANAGYESASELGGEYDEYIGYGEDGMLLLIDMNSRQILIYTEGTVNKTINSSYATTIADNIYTKAKAGDYDATVEEAFSEAASAMGGRKLAQPMKLVTSLLLAVALGLFISFLIAEFSSGALFGKDTQFSMNGVQVFNKRKNFIRENREYVPRNSESSGSGSGSPGSGSGSGSGGSTGSGGGHGF